MDLTGDMIKLLSSRQVKQYNMGNSMCFVYVCGARRPPCMWGKTAPMHKGQVGPMHVGQDSPYVLSHMHVVTIYQMYYT